MWLYVNSFCNIKSSHQKYELSNPESEIFTIISIKENGRTVCVCVCVCVCSRARLVCCIGIFVSKKIPSTSFSSLYYRVLGVLTFHLLYYTHVGWLFCCS